MQVGAGDLSRTARGGCLPPDRAVNHVANAGGVATIPGSRRLALPSGSGRYKN